MCGSIYRLLCNPVTISLNLRIFRSETLKIYVKLRLSFAKFKGYKSQIFCVCNDNWTLGNFKVWHPRCVLITVYKERIN